jgi:predicted Holliday junction resolvase-like endonuclease
VTAVLIAIAVVVVLVLVVLAMRGRIDARRREAASGLRREAFDREEKAKEAEITAREQRELAESRRARADRIDPDANGRADDDADVDGDTDVDAPDGEARPGVLGRLTGR